MKKEHSILGKFLSLFWAVLFVMTVTSCDLLKGDDGPVGPKGDLGVVGAIGPEGPVGSAGPVGNGNVTLYTYGQHDFSTVWSRTLLIPLSTGEVRERVLLLTYLVAASNSTYPIPGPGKNPSSAYRNFLFGPTNASSISMRIDRVVGAGELYTGIRVFKIVANSTVNGRIQLPDIDLQDYNAVADYFGFKD